MYAKKVYQSNSFFDSLLEHGEINLAGIRNRGLYTSQLSLFEIVRKSDEGDRRVDIDCQ